MSSCLLLASFAPMVGALHLCPWLGVQSGLALPWAGCSCLRPDCCQADTAVSWWGPLRSSRYFFLILAGVPRCFQATESAWPAGVSSSGFVSALPV